MAATETTNDAVIVIKPKDEGKVEIVENPDGGTTVTTLEPVKKLELEVTENGSLTTSGAEIRNARFSFTGQGQIDITNDIAKDIKVLGSDVGDDVVNLGANGEVGSEIKRAKIKTGVGADSVTAGGSFLKNVLINLGPDEEADVVTLDTDIASVKKMVIKNFGAEDTFVYDNTTYTFDDLQDQPFKPNITFKFN